MYNPNQGHQPQKYQIAFQDHQRINQGPSSTSIRHYPPSNPSNRSNVNITYSYAPPSNPPLKPLSSPLFPAQGLNYHPNKSDIAPTSVSFTEKHGPISKLDEKASKLVVDAFEEITNKKFKFPGEISLAKMHARTKHFGLPTGQKCPCCNEQQKKRFESIRYDPEQALYHDEYKHDKVRGLVAVVFFFKFIIYLILMLIVRFLLVDLYNVYSSLKYGMYCASGQCPQNVSFKYLSYQFWANSSLYHKVNAPQVIMVVDILSFIAVIGLIIYSKLYRGYLYNKNIKLDQKIIDQTDYTIYITNIPIVSFDPQKDVYSPKEQLRKFFQKRLKIWVESVKVKEIPKNKEKIHNQEVMLEYALRKIYDNKKKKEETVIQDEENVVDVNLCYDIWPIQRIQWLRESTMVRLESKDNLSERQITHGNNLMQQLNKDQLKIIKLYKSGGKLKQNLAFFHSTFIGSAFVTFKYEYFKDHILQEYEKNPESFAIQGQHIHIERASHPEDVRWENLRIPKNVRDQRIRYGRYIMGCVLIVSFFSLGILNILLFKVKGFIFDMFGATKFSWSWVSSAQTIVSIIITLFNTFLTTVSEKMVHWERHINSTDHFKSHLEKVVASTFINSALSLFCVSMVFATNAGDLINENGLVLLLLKFIVIDALKKIIFEYIGLNKIKKNMEKTFLGSFDNSKTQYNSQNYAFQVHLNELEQAQNFELVDKYTYYINIILLVSFSAYFAPISVPLTIILLCFMYWKDKKALFKNSSFSYELTYNFTRHAISLAQLSIPLYAAGVIIFSFYKIEGYPNTFHPLNVVGLAIACIFTGISYFWYEKFDELSFSNYLKKKRTNDIEYENNQFERSYEKMNPATRWMVKE